MKIKLRKWGQFWISRKLGLKYNCWKFGKSPKFGLDTRPTSLIFPFSFFIFFLLFLPSRSFSLSSPPHGFGRSPSPELPQTTRADGMGSDGYKTSPASLAATQMSRWRGYEACTVAETNSSEKWLSTANFDDQTGCHATQLNSLFEMVPPVFDKSARIVDTYFCANWKLCKWMWAKQILILR